jgi:hypothetical protein
VRTAAPDKSHTPHSDQHMEGWDRKCDESRGLTTGPRVVEDVEEVYQENLESASARYAHCRGYVLVLCGGEISMNELPSRCSRLRLTV